MTKETTLSKEDKAEQIGFHKGSLTTLAKEREELLRILNIVEQLMQMHLKALKDMGVDLESEAKKKRVPLESKL
ncbi:MAG: hypothetical protein AABX52_00295 [Nanoarchaeota archaeon]